MSGKIFYTVDAIYQQELVIKRSRFIGTLAPANSKSEAEAFLEHIRQKFPDATHHCYAYRLDEFTFRFADDGEPSGTAGRPILASLQNHALVYSILVVTRYFGGIKLGAAGLTRAYARCAENVIQAAHLIPFQKRVRLHVQCGYPMLPKVKAVMQKHGAREEDAQYQADVHIWISLPEADLDTFEADLRNGTSGNIKVEKLAS